MDGKIIFYIVGGIFYLIYTYFKNKSEQDQKNTSRPTYSSPENPFDDVSEHTKRMPETVVMPAPKPKTSSYSSKTKSANQQVFKGKDIFVREELEQHFEEGKFSFKRFSDKNFDEGGRITYDPGMEEPKEEAPSFNFNLRDAIVQSVILERKF